MGAPQAQRRGGDRLALRVRQLQLLRQRRQQQRQQRGVVSPVLCFPRAAFALAQARRQRRSAARRQRLHAQLQPRSLGQQRRHGAQARHDAANRRRAQHGWPLLPMPKVRPLPVLDGGQVAHEARDLRPQRRVRRRKLARASFGCGVCCARVAPSHQARIRRQVARLRQRAIRGEEQAQRVQLHVRPRVGAVARSAVEANRRTREVVVASTARRCGRKRRGARISARHAKPRAAATAAARNAPAARRAGPQPPQGEAGKAAHPSSCPSSPRGPRGCTARPAPRWRATPARFRPTKTAPETPARQTYAPPPP